MTNLRTRRAHDLQTQIADSAAQRNLYRRMARHLDELDADTTPGSVLSCEIARLYNLAEEMDRDVDDLIERAVNEGFTYEEIHEG